jgi:hypothetical protein
MIEATRNQIQRLVFGAVCLMTPPAMLAQSAAFRSAPIHSVQIDSPPMGSLSGRLTDVHSMPLSGVSIVLRNRITGTQAEAITAKNGAFRFASLEAGDYTLEAVSARLGRGQLQDIRVAGGAELRLRAALHFELASFASIDAIDRMSAGPAPPDPQAASASHTPAMPTGPGPSRTGVRSSTSLPPPVTMQPTLTASIPAELPRPMPVFAVESSQPTRSAAMHANSIQVPLCPAVRLPVSQPAHEIVGLERAALETRSVLPQTLLALASPKSLPLMADMASDRMPVTAAAQQADPIAPAADTTLTAEQIQTLPASGRRWQQFLLDAPASSADVSPAQASFHGGQESAATTIDGANTTLAFGPSAGASSHSAGAEERDTGQPGSLEAAWSGKRGLGVSEAAIREVSAVSGNVEASAMRAGGGHTGLLTESGANSLHGQGFLFDRQNNWGARNPYTQWVQNTGTSLTPNFTALPFTPPDHEMVWGFGAGGDILRNKLFWFAALDASHRNDPGLATVKDPSEFFDLPEPTSAPVALLSAQLGESQNQAYNDYLGIAASGHAAAGLEQLNALLGPASRTAANFTGFARIDWQATERQRFTIEGIGAESSAPGGGMGRISAAYGNHSFGSRESSDQLLLARWEAYITPNLLAVTQSSIGHDIARAQPSTPSAFEQTFLTGNFWSQLPQIVVDSRYGFTIGNLSRFGEGSYPDERLYQGRQMFDWVHNHLLLKAGFELDHNNDVTSLLRNQTGTYHYANVASFISDALAFERFGFADALDPRNPHNCGVTDTKFGSQLCYSYYSQTMGPSDWRLSTNDWGSYITAQWQPARLIVFSAGVRWEREQMPPPIAALANPEIPLTQSLPSLGNIGVREPASPLVPRVVDGPFCGSATACTTDALRTRRLKRRSRRPVHSTEISASLCGLLTTASSALAALPRFPTSLPASHQAPSSPEQSNSRPTSAIPRSTRQSRPWKKRCPAVLNSAAARSSASDAACPSPSTPTSIRPSIQEQSPTA